VTACAAVMAAGTGVSAAPAGAGTTVPTALLTASFADRQITPGDTSMLTFTIATNTDYGLSGLGFVQPLPHNMDVTGYALRQNCGRPVVSGVRAVKVVALDVAPNAVCTVEVIVAATVEGDFEVSPQDNAATTGNLIPGHGDVLHVRSSSPCTSLVAALMCPAGS